MPDNRFPQDDADAAQEALVDVVAVDVVDVVDNLKEGGDPEGAPANPTGTLAIGATPELPRRRVRAGSSAEILKLAWPAMLSMLFASTSGLLDIAMVGRLGAAAQAAVGVAQQLFFVAQSALFALSFAAVALIARAIGAGRSADARHALAASVLLALGIAAALFAALGIAPGFLFDWLGANAQVTQIGLPYMQLLMGSTMLTAIALMLESGLRADRDTFTPMLVTAVLTAAKIAGNGIFIFGWLGGPELGVTGAGVATLLSQAIAVVIFIGIAWRRPANSATALRPADFRGLGAFVMPLLRIATPSVFERLLMNLAMILYFKFIGGYGTEAIAAYTIGIRILSFSWIPGTSYSQAIATLVGQALGRGDVKGATRAGWRAVRLALLTATIMGALGVAFREPLAAIFTVDTATAQALGPFMLCLSLAQPFMQLHFTLAGAFRGAGDTLTPLLAALIGNWGLRIPLAFGLSMMGSPLEGLWVVLIFDHLSRALWLLHGFRRGAFRRAPKPVAGP